MSTVNISIKTSKDYTRFNQAGQARDNGVRLINLISGLVGGQLLGTVSVSGSTVDPVRASATATLTSCATDTITVGKTTFTGTGTPTLSTHFETDGSNTADAAALAAAINAHADTSKIVYATSASNVVTITAHQAGLLGNHIVLSETGSTIVCTGSGYLIGGTGGASAAPVFVR